MQWDADNSGCIDRKEWRKAMSSLGIEATKEELDAVLVSFDLIQPDGTISYKELDKELRKLPAVPSSGPERDLALKAHQQHKLRRGPSSRPGSTLAATGMKLGGGGGSGEQKAKSIQDQLRDGLAANLTRVIDLFRDWDADFSGTIDKKEFRKAIAILGYEAPRADIDELFDSFDSDRGGFVDYAELNRVLRQHAEIDEQLKAGAAGKIDLKAVNKFALADAHERRGPRKSRTVGNYVSALDSSKPLVSQLAAAISASWTRVTDLFHEWDTDGGSPPSGRVAQRAVGWLGCGLMVGVWLDGWGVAGWLVCALLLQPAWWVHF